MGKLKIVPMASEIAAQVRKTLKAPGYGFPAQCEMAAGRAPTRRSSDLIRPNEEELILFTYDAFAGQGVPPMPGPVYVHAKDCRAYSGEEQVPEEYRGQPLTFEAFGAERTRLGEKRVHGSGEENAGIKDNVETRKAQRCVKDLARSRKN